MRYTRAICHINLAKHFGGGERQTELLIEKLAEAGWSQRLIVREGHELSKRLGSCPQLDIREVASNPVAAALATRGAILVHAHEARGIYSGLLAKLLFRIPYVLTRRVVNPQKSSWIRSQAYQQADAVVAISNAAAGELRKTQPALDIRTIMDANATFQVDTRTRDEVCERFDGKFLIGHIGALVDAAKGQRTLFEVARAATDEHPDWQFLLLGDGRDREAFEEQARDLENVHLEGFVDNVGDYLAAFDLFVFPSIYEAVGSSLLDAMQAGLPIVASDTGGIPEIIVDGRNGLLVEPRDAQGFKNAIETLQTDDTLRTKMIEANRADARTYSASAMTAEYVKLYRAVMANAP